MADRCTLHIKHLEPLNQWLGDLVEPCKGEYEVLRWRNVPGRPMCIIFRRGYEPKEHYTCNDAALWDVGRFLRHYKNNSVRT